MSKILTGIVATVAVASLAANVLLYERYSTSRPLVRVGSEVITKKDYQDRLDYQTQGAVLKQLVYDKLVMQTATSQGVMPTEKDVDQRVAEIQRQGQGPLFQVLFAASQNPEKMAEAKHSLAVAMALENLQTKDVAATDAEVAGYYQKHRQEFVQPPQVRTTMVVTNNSVDSGTAAALLRQGDSAGVIAHQPRLQVVGVNGFNINLQALPPALNQQIKRDVMAMKQGSVKTISVKTPAGVNFLAIRADAVLAPGAPPLAQIKDEVARAVKLQKAAQAVPPGINPSAFELAKIYQTAKPKFEVERYASYFSDMQNLDLKSASNPRKMASTR